MALLTTLVLGCFLLGLYYVPHVVTKLAMRRFVRRQPMVQPRVVRVNYFHFENGDILEETIHG